VTEAHASEPRLLWAAPLAGLALGLAYERAGESLRAGSSLVVHALRDDTARVPLRLAPLVLAGTLVTHLVGGSAGREGTAVQMGASLADALARLTKAGAAARRELVVGGVAGGFGSVFGTPLAGMVFSLEVGITGRIDAWRMAPALAASFVGDLTARTLGARHAMVPRLAPVPLTWDLAARWALLAAACAAAARLFVGLVHGVKRHAEAAVPRLTTRLVVGGALLAVVGNALEARDFLGLGLPLLDRALRDPALPAYAFAAKLALTALTLGVGFVGGEVTPLFVAGAALGNVAGRALGLPFDLAAAVGLAAVFGAAANTPFALTLLAAEVAGAAALPHAGLVCLLAFALSGPKSIYSTQGHEPPPEDDKAPRPSG
jgi:H+/Cl- antiporter ClcA